MKSPFKWFWNQATKGFLLSIFKGVIKSRFSIYSLTLHRYPCISCYMYHLIHPRTEFSNSVHNSPSIFSMVAKRRTSLHPWTLCSLVWLKSDHVPISLWEAVRSLGVGSREDGKMPHPQPFPGHCFSVVCFLIHPCLEWWDAMFLFGNHGLRGVRANKREWVAQSKTLGWSMIISVTYLDEHVF